MRNTFGLRNIFSMFNGKPEKPKFGLSQLQCFSGNTPTYVISVSFYATLLWLDILDTLCPGEHFLFSEKNVYIF